jgi:hypothetical protein
LTQDEGFFYQKINFYYKEKVLKRKTRLDIKEYLTSDFKEGSSIAEVASMFTAVKLL